jgi:hypothetical protein
MWVGIVGGRRHLRIGVPAAGGGLLALRLLCTFGPAGHDLPHPHGRLRPGANATYHLTVRLPPSTVSSHHLVATSPPYRQRRVWLQRCGQACSSRMKDVYALARTRLNVRIAVKSLPYTRT